MWYPQEGFRKHAARRAEAERRSSARHDADEIVAELSWRQGGATLRSPVLILQVSHGGAQVLVDGPIDDGTHARLRLRGAASTRWVPAVVRGDRPLRSGHRILGLEFCDHCPYDLFRRAILGPSAEPDDVA